MAELISVLLLWVQVLPHGIMRIHVAIASKGARSTVVCGDSMDFVTKIGLNRTQ